MSRIIILGGGFGGIRAALDLEKKLGKKAEIILIDKNPYHLYVPALYEIAAAYSKSEDKFSRGMKSCVGIPFRDIFDGKRIKFIQAELDRVDLRAKMVMTKGEEVFSYDYLVLALGSQIADFGIAGVREYACQFRTLQDALMINQQMRLLLENKPAPAVGGAPIEAVAGMPIKILICGAGFSGIELAAELAKFVRRFNSDKASKHSARIYIFEAGLKILPNISDKEREIIKERLTGLGIIVMENSRIQAVGDRSVVLAQDGQKMDGDIVIWTAGLRANEFLMNIMNLELTSKGKIIVDERLQIPSQKNVFAVGDNIEFIDHKTQKPIPSLAYLAVDHGVIVAENIYASVYNKKLKTHKPFYDVWVAPVGGKWAVAHLTTRLTLQGFWGWLVHEAITLRYFLGILSLGRALKFFLRDLWVFGKND